MKYFFTLFLLLIFCPSGFSQGDTLTVLDFGSSEIYPLGPAFKSEIGNWKAENERLVLTLSTVPTSHFRLPTFASERPKPKIVEETFTPPAGKLFIIGGGKRPPALVQALVGASGLDEGGYAIILPMASSEPDTAAWYGIRQFVELGLAAEKFRAYNFEKGNYSEAAIDSLRGARLIYITGGDQNRFMDVVLGSPVYDAIHYAYNQGGTIAGTSAGAAVMSRMMITGNELKHPEYTGDFRTIEADNMEVKEGLGLLPDAIVDQHFIYRMRMNRLITVALEHPRMACIGIDESTAILVEGDEATVIGDYQVILLRNSHEARRQNGLLGGRGLELSVLLPGEVFELR